MSGYGDERRRTSRDYRERSPSGGDRHDKRSSSRSYQDARSAQYGHTDNRHDSQGPGRDYGRDRGSTRGRGRGGGHPQAGSHGTSPDETLPALPSTVPIPTRDSKLLGGKLDLKPQYPKGTSGRPVNVLVNHFAISSLPVIKIYQYDIRMAVPSSSQRRGSEKVSAMQQAKVLLRVQSLWGSSFVFDGVSLGWSPDLLMPNGESRSTTIDLDDHTAIKPNQVDIHVRCNGPLNIRGLVNYLMSGTSGLMAHDDPSIEDCFKMLNALFRQDPASRFITRPRSSAFFQRSPGLMMTLQSTGGILEALRGMYQSVAVSFNSLCLNVDVVASAFYTPDLCLVEVAGAYAGISTRQGLTQVATSDMLAQACDRMVGMFINVKHLSAARNVKKMRIQRIVRQGARETTFEMQNRETGQSSITSVADYFREKYNIALQFPNLPLLDCKDGMFPMELCFTAHGERYKEALQGEQTSDFIRWATSPAFVRSQQIMDNVKRLHWHELELPKSYGLSVSTKMLEVQGRVLPCPLPIYGSGTDARGPDTGAWNLRGKRFLKPKGFKSWGLLYIPGGSRVDDRTLQDFARTLATSLSNVGLATPSGPPAFLLGNPQSDLSEAIENLYGTRVLILGKTGNAFNRKPDIFFFLLHGASTSIYKIIKNVCEVKLGVASQVMLVEKAFNLKGQLQYLGNIGLKVNAKLGGTNSCVGEPLFKRTRYMMMGGDSSHPSPGELRKMPPPPSYSALCASYDDACVTYTAVCTAQPATVELIGDFKPMAKELLNRYKGKHDGAFPEAIIYWRDGIAESQLPAFLQSEVKALREVCQELKQQIKITVVNCVKRHHTRLFPAQGDRGDKLGNVLPGTVVEASRKQDIFLVSQSALQGCVRPCHYTVICDDSQLSADDFQRITHNLCFAYARATRSVSIVPAVYYADQACERARLHLRTANDTTFLLDVKQDLAYTMYWQ